MESDIFEVIEFCTGKGALCREILESLPEWFGIPEAIDSYVSGVKDQPMLVCRDRSNGEVVGFLSLRFHAVTAVEAYVLGVRRQYQHRGYGRALFNSAMSLARAHGASFMTVKTLAATSADSHYAKTRQFYERIGFVPLEVFPSLWGKENPCLLMIMAL